MNSFAHNKVNSGMIIILLSQYYFNIFSPVLYHSHFFSKGVDLLKMASWIIKYQEDLRDFIDDDRIEHGLITLLRIHTTKSTEVAEGIIDGILEFEKRSDLTTEAKSAIKQGETLTNNVPIDLFKIINEGLDFSYKMCPCPELCR